MRRIIKDRISVIIPIYGEFDKRRTIISVESILQQRQVDFQIIISEQGTNAQMKPFSDRRVKYVFNRHIPKEDLSDFNPGRVRNYALDIADGEFIYTNDADIVFINPNFLKESIDLIKTDRNLSLIRPPMRRLVIDQFESFWELYNDRGIEGALVDLDLSQDYIATLDGKDRPLKVVTDDSSDYIKLFTTSIDNYMTQVSHLEYAICKKKK